MASAQDPFPSAENGRCLPNETGLFLAIIAACGLLQPAMSGSVRAPAGLAITM